MENKRQQRSLKGPEDQSIKQSNKVSTCFKTKRKGVAIPGLANRAIQKAALDEYLGASPHDLPNRCSE